MASTPMRQSESLPPTSSDEAEFVSSSHNSLSLSNLPHEILTLIAYHLTTSTPIPSPISDIRSILLTNRAIHSHLSITANPQLYAQIYDVKFDTSAVLRRSKYLSKADRNALPRSKGQSPRLQSRAGSPASAPQKGCSVSPSVPPSGTQVDVTSTSLCSELIRRYEVLQRLKMAVHLQKSDYLTEDDVWVIYFMLLENDGKNIQHLISPASGKPLLNYVRLYHEQDLVYEATQPGFPSMSLKRTLMIWVIWLLTTRETIEDEGMEQIEEFLFVLRPYVFAVKQFDLFFAPWTLSQLPAPSEPNDEHDQQENDDTGPHAGRAGGSRLPINPYLANLSPRNRSRTVTYYGQQIQLSPPILSHASILNFFARIDNSMGVSRFGLMEGLQNPAMPGNHQLILFQPRVNSRQVAFTSISTSTSHDLDFKRLVQCSDATRSKGLDLCDWLGKFEGCWEGNFCFFDFDAFRSMLSGEAGSLYEGQFGEQAQVWRLFEVVTRRREQGEPGSSLNAGFPEGTSAFDQVLATQAIPKNSQASTASAVVNLFENCSERARAMFLLPGLTEKDILSAEEINAIKKDGMDEDLELYIGGTGHSAFGEFVLRGRVRLWDGMISLVKEYSPDGRGRWLYRGYVLGGNVFVGRWRDCVTPADYIGYEGTFTLSQRVEEA